LVKKFQVPNFVYMLVCKNVQLNTSKLQDLLFLKNAAA